MERHRLAKALRIVPPNGRPRPPLPAPDPPTSGWWIDPTDPRFERYHNGERWTDRQMWITARRRVARPSPIPSPEPDVPNHQGIFPLGAGPAGVPLAKRRSPATAPYPGKGAIWGWVGAFCAGFTIFWLGLRTTGTARISLIAIGAVIGLGSVGWLALSAWRGGFRPPGFWAGADPRDRWLGSLWLRLLVGGVLVAWVTPALDRGSLAYDWLNRIGVILADSAAFQGCLLAVYSSLFIEYDGPPGKEWIKKANLFIGLGAGAFFLWVTWDRILDALWIR